MTTLAPCKRLHHWHNDASLSQVPPEADWCVVCGAMRSDPRKMALGGGHWAWFEESATSSLAER